MSTCYVRLKPLDPGRGHVKERYRMGAACGWGDLMFIAGELHELDPAAGQYLATTVHQQDHNPASPKAFDLWYSREECAKALRDEKLAKLGRTRRPGINHNAAKPPKLKSSVLSDLDEPAGSTVIEDELADQIDADATGDLGAAAPRDTKGNLIKSADGDFGDLVPSDNDLVNAALDSASQPAEPQAKTRPPAPKRVARKKAAKNPAAKKPTPGK